MYDVCVGWSLEQAGGCGVYICCVCLPAKPGRASTSQGVFNPFPGRVECTRPGRRCRPTAVRPFRSAPSQAPGRLVTRLGMLRMNGSYSGHVCGLELYWNFSLTKVVLTRLVTLHIDIRTVAFMFVTCATTHESRSGSWFQWLRA